MRNMVLGGDEFKMKQQSRRTSGGLSLRKSPGGCLLFFGGVLVLGRASAEEADIFSVIQKKYSAPSPSKKCSKGKGSCKDQPAKPPTFDPWWGDNKPDFSLPSKKPTPSPTRVGGISPPPVKGPSVQPTTVSARGPTSAPIAFTSLPTSIPTTTFKPTDSPKPSITHIPTVSPGPSIVGLPPPSTEPTLTDPPDVDTTSAPSTSNTTDNTNSTQVTMAPDASPTSSPTVSRDQAAPTPAPFVQAGSNTASPSQSQPTGASPSCTIVGGSFGSTLGNPTQVVFGYEVETDPEFQNGPFALDVLPGLEESMTNFLLPVLFPETCSEPSEGGDATATTRSGTDLIRRRLEVVGISSLPTDQISTSVECRELLVATNNCNFLDGQLTINYVSRSGETLESFVRLILERLRFGMDSDAFLDTHPSIERVSFIIGLDDTPDTVAPTDPNSGRDIVDDDDDGIRWWPWLLIGSVLFIACCGLLCFRLTSARPASTPQRTASEGDMVGEDLPSTT
eukprot:scaffold140_cov163-Amphora_coffeaeformis.AAC.10